MNMRRNYASTQNFIDYGSRRYARFAFTLLLIKSSSIAVRLIVHDTTMLLIKQHLFLSHTPNTPLFGPLFLRAPCEFACFRRGRALTPAPGLVVPKRRLFKYETQFIR